MQSEASKQRLSAAGLWVENRLYLLINYSWRMIDTCCSLTWLLIKLLVEDCYDRQNAAIKSTVHISRLCQDILMIERYYDSLPALDDDNVDSKWVIQWHCLTVASTNFVLNIELDKEDLTIYPKWFAGLPYLWWQVGCPVKVSNLLRLKDCGAALESCQGHIIQPSPMRRRSAKLTPTYQKSSQRSMSLRQACASYHIRAKLEWPMCTLSWSCRGMMAIYSVMPGAFCKPSKRM